MRSRLLLAGVVAFVVVDVLLITLAVRSTQGGDSDAGTAPAGSASSPSPDPDEPMDEASTPREPRRGAPLLMAAGANGTVLRAQPGSCDGESARVSLSRDSGATFDGVDTGARVVLRLHVASLSDMWLAGLNGDCNRSFYRSGDAGQGWQANPGTQGAWHLLPGEEQALHAPDGDVDLPCVPVALSSVDFQFAAAGCENGDLLTTDDRGGSWSTVGSVPGVVDLAFVGRQQGFALSAGTDCAAVVSGTSDGGSSWEEVGCIEGPGRARAMAQLAGGDLLVQTGRQVHRSSDGGASWQRL